MGLDSHYATPEAKNKGRWFEIDGDDGQVKIRHLGNEDMARFFREHREVFGGTTNHRAILRDQQGGPDGEKLEDLLNEGLAENVLVDWKNISLEDEELASKFDKAPGEKIGYSVENANLMFELIPGFRAEVWEIATAEEAFLEEVKEEDEKN